jgi:hypothetical protein
MKKLIGWFCFDGIMIDDFPVGIDQTGEVIRPVITMGEMI